MRGLAWAPLLRSFLGFSAGVGAVAIICVHNAGGAGASERDGTRAAMSFAVRAIGRVSGGPTTSSIDPLFARALAAGTQPVVYVSAPLAGLKGLSIAELCRLVLRLPITSNYYP